MKRITPIVLFLGACSTLGTPASPPGPLPHGGTGQFRPLTGNETGLSPSPTGLTLSVSGRGLDGAMAVAAFAGRGAGRTARFGAADPEGYRRALGSFLDRYDEYLPAVAPDGGTAAMGGDEPCRAVGRLAPVAGIEKTSVLKNCSSVGSEIEIGWPL